MSDSGSNGKMPAKRKLNLSPEERKRRSDAAKKRIAEGKMGGQFGRLGGRPRKPRASDLLAEEAQKRERDLLSVLEDAIDDSQPISIRLKGLETWLGIEKDSRRLEMDEDEHYSKMSRDELAEHITARFMDNPMLAKLVVERLSGDAIDTTAEEEEIEDAEVVDDEAEVA